MWFVGARRYYSNMSSSEVVLDRDVVTAAFGALSAAFEMFTALPVEALTNPERLAALEHLETLERRLPALRHRVINLLAEQASPTELGGTSLADVLARRLRISRAEARRRISDAEHLGPRWALTGEALPARLPATAAAQAAGSIGAEHVRIIRSFFTQLPDAVDVGTREAAEGDLARLASGFGPEQLRKCAQRMDTLLNPDGTFSDADRARRRGLTLGRQGSDGMSPIAGFLDPEARAYLDAVLAKWAAPGRCNPEDQTPTVDGEPSDPAAERDARSPAQRNHDALKAALRAVLASGELGQHRGLPVTVVVSATLQDLESAAGHAVTGGGGLLPMSDVIRMASHSHHYLVIFDEHTGRPLYLGRTKRIASADQRIVLHAKDRGCSRPGCTAPGYECEVHHVDEWAAAGGQTNADELTFTCKPDHKLIEQGWTTRKRRDGCTEWIPPPHLDTGQPRTNDYHHPERLLTDDDQR
jgi:hypothetical protein